MTNQSIENKDSQDDFFLPNFCHIQSVFVLMVLAELLALTFTLLNISSAISFWNQLGLYSISIQLISLFCVSVLCLLRPYLAKFSDFITGLISLIIILLITAIFSFFAFNLLWYQPLDPTQTEQTTFIVRNLLIASLIGMASLRYFYLLQQYRLKLSSESNARLQALQARIRPHFLFNSMNVIASLTRIDGRQAEKAIEDLSDLFRATLSQSNNLVSLEEELNNGRKYLSLEKLRLGERLKIDENISSESLGVMIPPLSIQPLLENAVYHGIQQIPEGGSVNIYSEIDQQKLILTVTNPTSENQRKQGNGIALKNIAERLKVIFGEQGKLLKVKAGNQYKVTIMVPVAFNQSN